MKITVLTILILIFMAGLAMVQMDVNTDNQIQVLNETEMLTTQGGEDIGKCQKESNIADGEPGPYALDCNSTKCENLVYNLEEWSFDLTKKRIGNGYVWCMKSPNVNFDCRKLDYPQNTQECAVTRSYWGLLCFGYFRSEEWETIPAVKEDIRDHPCVRDENGNLVPVTSS